MFISLLLLKTLRTFDHVTTGRRCVLLSLLNRQRTDIRWMCQLFGSRWTASRDALKRTVLSAFSLALWPTESKTYVRPLQSSQVKRTAQNSMNEFIIRKLSPLAVVDFRGSTKIWNPESGNGNGITETETETEYGICERRFQAIDLKKRILAMTMK